MKIMKYSVVAVPTMAVESECYDYNSPYQFGTRAPPLRRIICRKPPAAAAAGGVEEPAGAIYLGGWLRSGSLYDHECPFLTPWDSKPSVEPASEESTKSQPGLFSFFAHEVHDEIKLMKQAQRRPADEYSSNETESTDASFPQNHDQANALDQLDYSTQWQNFYDQYFAEKFYDRWDCLKAKEGR